MANNNNNNHNNFNLRSLMEKEKLNDTNFLDWYRNLRVVLKFEGKIKIIEEPLPNPPSETATAAQQNAYRKLFEEQEKIAMLMMSSMTPSLMKQFEDQTAYDMITELKNMFQKQAHLELFETQKLLHTCKMQEGTSVSSHVLKMKSYIDRLERLGTPLPPLLAVNTILGSLPKSFDNFVMNYNMQGWEKSLSELHQMLKTAEQNVTSRVTNPGVLVINEGRVNKKKKPKASWKGKGKGVAKKKIPPPPKKENPTKDHDCFHFGERGHWRRNCPIYLGKLKKGTAGETSKPGIYHIRLYTFSSDSWIFDTGCGIHICNKMQGMRRSRTLKKGSLDLRVGDGGRAAVQAIGSYELTLPSGLSVLLEHCHYAPSITCNIVSVSLLKSVGYELAFTHFGISVCKDNMFYFNVYPRDGIFEIDMRGENLNDDRIYALPTKRIKHDLNDTYLWHCRLGHINKQRISKLQSNGLISTDSESFDKCESCLCGKMTKAPFSGVGERAKDLLGLVHSDVCGPFRTMTRNGDSYFVTFTDDYSRYGYVYLLKHKHEVF